MNKNRVLEEEDICNRKTAQYSLAVNMPAKNCRP